MRGRASLAVLLRVTWLWLVLAASVCANADQSVGDAHTVTSASTEARRIAACARLASTPFPATAIERRADLQRLESALESCKDQPAFLALLGGLWLEEGDPSRALLWLERSLLLAPGLLAAQADHALALAALGDFTARNELMDRWRLRTDVPALVWARLRSTVPSVSPPESRARWARFREVALLYGFESNLDHSPRLTELTITPPDGPVDLPLTQPLRPRPGSAGTLDAAWQAAFSPTEGTVLQAGLQGSARSSPSEPAADWHSLQLAMSLSQRWRSWRGQLQAGYTSFGGALNEPYRLARFGLSLEGNGGDCTQRWAVDRETRRQSSTRLHDSASLGGVWNLQCRAPIWSDWTYGLAVRAVVDRPNDAERPGGVQRQASVALRAFGPMAGRWRVDLNLRATRSLDDAGYSDLLGNNARRWMNLAQVGVELSHPTDSALLRGGEAVIQLQSVRQQSNLAVFEFSSTGLFGGLRWRW